MIFLYAREGLGAWRRRRVSAVPVPTLPFSIKGDRIKTRERCLFWPIGRVGMAEIRHLGTVPSPGNGRERPDQYGDGQSYCP